MLIGLNRRESLNLICFGKTSLAEESTFFVSDDLARFFNRIFICWLRIFWGLNSLLNNVWTIASICARGLLISLGCSISSLLFWCLLPFRCGGHRIGVLRVQGLLGCGRCDVLLLRLQNHGFS